MAAGNSVRVDERLRFSSITLSDGSQVTGVFWLVRGNGDLQGSGLVVLTDGETFYPLAQVRSFALH